MFAKKGTLFGVVLIDDNTIVMKRLDKSKLFEEFNNAKSNIKKVLGSKIIEELENI